MKRWQKVVLAAVAVVAGALVVASFILDGVLTSKAHEEARTLSQQWKRPVEIGSVKTRLLTGLGARVSNVEIGRAKGESAPWSPTVTELDLKPAVSEIVRQGGSALVQKALGVEASQAEQQAQKKVEEEAKNRLKDLFGK